MSYFTRTQLLYYLLLNFIHFKRLLKSTVTTTHNLALFALIGLKPNFLQIINGDLVSGSEIIYFHDLV